MSEQNNPKQECKCDGGKKVKALEKQVAELFEKFEQLKKQIDVLRKAATK